MMLCDTCFHANTCVNFCVGEGAYETTGCQYYDNAVHICDLLTAEKDGRLVVLPCKVGDTVYRISQKEKVTTVGIDDEGMYVATNVAVYRENHFGTLLYLAREAAEAALGGEEHD